MELEDIYPAVLTIVIIGIVLGIGLFMLNKTIEAIGYDAASFDEDILADNNSAQTLSVTPYSLSASAINNSWLSFDGVNDYVFIDDNSYETISYWVNDTSNNWIHVVNTSGILYEDGNEVSSLTLNSYYKNTTGWYIGQNSSDDFFTGNIDSIKFYNDTINETIVDAIYSNGI